MLKYKALNSKLFRLYWKMAVKKNGYMNMIMKLKQ